ncbi:DMT family transporter [Roseovarius pacificus]|uniref:DMT family transporter n=1 Tax=Roseovarius pacificus TaxID=337701 RepID=UPI002A18AA61|nr:DMT family transporter [Roseovarius pacificus]
MTFVLTTARRPSIFENGTLTGMICMTAAMLLLPIGDTLSKLLTGYLSAVEVTAARLLAQGCCLFPLAFFMRHRLRGPMFSPIVALSGGLVMVTLTSLIWAFSVMPIATVIAIFFAEPLILTALVGPLLGERVGLRRMIAVLVGLLGVLIIIRPGGGIGLVAFLPLLAALCYAVNMIVLRKASGSRSSLTVQCGATFYACLGMIALSLGLNATGQLQPAFVDLPLWAWGVVLASGALAAISFILIAEAFRQAEAGMLAPFQYLEIIGATAAGYLVFADFPDDLTWIGIAIILSSGLYVFWREHVPANRGNLRPRRRRTRRIRSR